MNSKQLSIVLGVVVVILLAVVGYMAMRNNSQTDTLSQQTTTPNSNLANTNANTAQPLNNTNTQTPTNTTPTSTDDTASWKETFYNNTLGFSMKLPNDWEQKGAYLSDTSVGFAPKNVRSDVVITVRYPKQTLAEYKTYHPYLNSPDTQNKLIKEDQVTINGRQWTKLTFKQNGTGYTFLSHLTERDGRVYDVSVGSDAATDVRVYNGMLSTFKFSN